MQVHVLKKAWIQTVVEAAAERAAQLIAELAGGEVLEGTVVVDELDKSHTRSQLYLPDFINNRLGMKISLEEMTSISNRLKFEFEAQWIAITLKHQHVVKILQIEEDISRRNCSYVWI